jgi:hypothetical protein
MVPGTGLDGVNDPIGIRNSTPCSQSLYRLSYSGSSNSEGMFPRQENHVTAATDTETATEVLLEAVFPVRFALRLHDEDTKPTRRRSRVEAD